MIMNRLLPSFRQALQLAFSILLASATPVFAQNADSTPAATARKVALNIEHGIELPWKKPGFRIEISGWLPNGALSIHAIGSGGEKVDIVPLDKPLHADPSGAMVVDIDYARQGLHPGHWILIIGGKPGAHVIRTDLPLVEPPTASNPKWRLTFGQTGGKSK